MVVNKFNLLILILLLLLDTLNVIDYRLSSKANHSQTVGAVSRGPEILVIIRHLASLFSFLNFTAINILEIVDKKRKNWATTGAFFKNSVPVFKLSLIENVAKKY